jgi:hypothetical protein
MLVCETVWTKGGEGGCKVLLVGTRLESVRWSRIREGNIKPGVVFLDLRC